MWRFFFFFSFFKSWSLLNNMACHGVMMFTRVFKYRKKVGEVGFWCGFKSLLVILKLQNLFYVDITLWYVCVSFVSKFGTLVCVVFILQVFGWWINLLNHQKSYLLLCYDATRFNYCLSIGLFMFFMGV